MESEHLASSLAARAGRRRAAWFAALVFAWTSLPGCSNSTTEPARSATAAGAGGLTGAGGDSGISGDGATTTAGGGPVDLGSSVTNARQVGGLATTTGDRVRANVLIRSGELSQVDCTRLAALGIATVIDLRDAADASATPDATCVSTGTRYFLADLPKILPPTADSYLQTLDAMEPKLDAIFAELTRDKALPALIHCVIGRDRASLTMALVLLGLGVSEADVLQDFVANQATAGSTAADWMSGVVARIDAAGGVDAYLAAHDVTADELAVLKTQALE